MSPHHPMCWICGVVVGARLSSDPGWGGLPVYDPEVIREEDLRWCNFYRAIIFRSDKRDSPFLSGVGCFTDAQNAYIAVPHAQEAKYDDDPSPETIEFVPVDARGWEEDYANVYGYLIHTYCWNFLEDSVGHAIYCQLVPLSHVLRTRWLDEDYGGAKPLLDIVWEGGRRELLSTVELVTDPVDVPEVLSLRKKCTRDISQEVVVTHSNESKDWLPLELKLMVLDYLEYCDVQSIQSALGWKVPAHYWRKRFRSSLFFELKEFSPQEDDWFLLWFASEDLLHNKPPLGLSNRWRIFNIISGVIRDLNSYGSLYQAGEPSTDLDLWSIVYKSARINELANHARAVLLPSTVRKLNFSFVKAKGSEGFLLSGIKILPEGLTLGYCLPDEALSGGAIFSVPTTLSGIMVKLDAIGIRDIMPMCKNYPSHWIIGFSNENSSVGVLFDNEDSEGIEICAMIDANKFTAIGSILKNKYAVQCARHKKHDCFRQTQLWRPDVPVATYNLNEDQYPRDSSHQDSIGPLTPRHQEPYQPLRYIIFGGKHGELLPSIKSIKGFKTQKWWGPTGLEFFYDDGSSVLFGSRGEFESELLLQSRQGEYIQEVECRYRTPGLRPRSFEIKTNFGHSMSLVTRVDEVDLTVSVLVASQGERIVGFYSGPGIWFSHKPSSQTTEDFVGFGIITTTMPDLSRQDS